MPQCGHVREAKQTSLWCNELVVCVCVLVECMCATIRVQACVRMKHKVLLWLQPVRALTWSRVTRLGGRKI